MLIAIPSEAPGGLDAPISAHFGRCAAFTLVELSGGDVGASCVVPNVEHTHGGCLTPVHLLQAEGVEALVAGGMGARPLAGFQDVGIKVFFKEGATTVSEAVQLLGRGGCREFGPSQTCGGGGDTCGHGHHHGVERQPVEGPMAAGPGRAVAFTYTLFDAESGEQIDSSRGRGPVSYLHGFEQILPGLERALEGLEVDASATVTLSADEAYGPYDARLVRSVPRTEVKDGVKVGGRVRIRTPQGIAVLRVLEVTDDAVTLDANHPLAGRALRFEVQVVDVQQAAPEELSAGRLLV